MVLKAIWSSKTHVRRVRKSHLVPVDEVTNKWVCFLVNNNFLRRYKRSVEDEMRRVFGKDLLAFDIMPDGVEELYAFAKVRNYQVHADTFKSNSSVKNILPSAENPYFISDDEVKQFIQSATPILVIQNFRVGDVVRVQVGFLKNLVGMVTGNSSGDRYTVLFKFHTRQFHRVIKSQELHRLSNVFSVARVPLQRIPVTDSTTAKSILNDRDKRRPQHRKSGKQKK